MSRQQIQRTSRPRENTEVAEELPGRKDSSSLDAIDELLDEIEEVLEENAAELVASYRQRGGQ